MAKKPNPMLAAFEAKKEAEFSGRLACNSEIGMMALLIAAHRELKVGPGRASFLLAEYIDVKTQIAGDILEDVGDSHKKNGNGDKEFLHTKRDLAITLKQILGPEKWLECRELFPMLRSYWDI